MGVYYVSGIHYPSDYLMHFGIKGQKWGVRRFQNPDGTLTAAGKERYGSEKEQKRLASEITKGKTNLSKSPQVRHAVANLEDAVIEEIEQRKRLDSEIDKFYNDKKLLEEYTEKSANRILKDSPNIANSFRDSRPTNMFNSMNDKEVVKWFLKNDDWGQGDYDPLTIFMESGDRRATELNRAEEAHLNATRNLNNKSREYAKSFLGSYGDRVYTRQYAGLPKGLKTTIENTLTNTIVNSAYSDFKKYYDD